ncbi:MAG: sigma-70 family RNA polymerase sigma factor [Bacteroidales bacterium]|nr:sigma-70 family RNA polymerase sigma factor [Bacteroidales bacterium]
METNDVQKTELIERCQRGDITALGSLYTTYRRPMIRVIKRYVADTAMIEDILHDGFFIIFKQIDRLHDYSHLETWMASIMKNLALKALADPA